MVPDAGSSQELERRFRQLFLNFNSVNLLAPETDVRIKYWHK